MTDVQLDFLKPSSVPMDWADQSRCGSGSKWPRTFVAENSAFGTKLAISKTEWQPKPQDARVWRGGWARVGLMPPSHRHRDQASYSRTANPHLTRNPLRRDKGAPGSNFSYSRGRPLTALQLRELDAPEIPITS